MRLLLQVVLASKELAGRVKGIGRPAEPDFDLVANIVIHKITISICGKRQNQGKIIENDAKFTCKNLFVIFVLNSAHDQLIDIFWR